MVTVSAVGTEQAPTSLKTTMVMYFIREANLEAPSQRFLLSPCLKGQSQSVPLTATVIMGSSVMVQSNASMAVAKPVRLQTATMGYLAPPITATRAPTPVIMIPTTVYVITGCGATELKLARPPLAAKSERLSTATTV